jgi:hypothetical protein
MKNAYPSQNSALYGPRHHVINKCHKIKHSWNSTLKGIYFMLKCQIPKFLFNSFWTNMFGSALEPQGDLGKKITTNLNFLEFYFREALFYAENPKFKTFRDPSPHFGGPLGLR